MRRLTSLLRSRRMCCSRGETTAPRCVSPAMSANRSRSAGSATAASRPIRSAVPRPSTTGQPATTLASHPPPTPSPTTTVTPVAIPSPPDLAPDLVVTTFSAPSAIAVDQFIPLELTVQNRGSADVGDADPFTGQPITTAFYVLIFSDPPATP